jgi:hypothetical protein
MKYSWTEVICACAIYFVGLVVLTVMTLDRATAKEQPTASASVVSNDYRVKIFYLHRLNVDTAEEIERRIAVWLKENNVEPIAISQSCGASIHGATENTLVITIMYKKLQ